MNTDLTAIVIPSFDIHENYHNLLTLNSSKTAIRTLVLQKQLYKIQNSLLDTITHSDCSFRYASPCLWNQSMATSFQSLCLWLACSHFYLIFSHCQLTTLTIRNSLFLSLPAQDLLLFFHKSFPPNTLFRPQNWLHGLYDWTVSSEHLGFWFLVFFSTLLKVCLVPCGRLSWLPSAFGQT